MVGSEVSGGIQMSEAKPYHQAADDPDQHHGYIGGRGKKGIEPGRFLASYRNTPGRDHSHQDESERQSHAEGSDEPHSQPELL